MTGTTARAKQTHRFGIVQIHQRTWRQRKQLAAVGLAARIWLVS